jgi:hypothetical protein
VRVFDCTFLGAYDFAAEELLFQIDRMFSCPGASESKTPWSIEDWDHERDDAVVVGIEQVETRQRRVAAATRVRRLTSSHGDRDARWQRSRWRSPR